MTLRIVTDSTCDLPDHVIRELGISVVPLFINIGQTGYLDGVEITRKAFYTSLPDYKVHPTTGTPGMEAFIQAYTRLASEGASQILSIHISQSLSATVEVARQAAKEFDQVPVLVRDSGQLSTGTGFQVETAARMAQGGESLDEILRSLDDMGSRTFVAARLDTLEYLRRSGRMNAFMTGLGSLLQLKPILTMADGSPDSERVRTVVKADARLVAMLTERLPIERFALLHTNAAGAAEAFRSKVTHLLPDDQTYSMNITPVIGAHIGPGAVGFALISQKVGRDSGRLKI